MTTTLSTRLRAVPVRIKERLVTTARVSVRALRRRDSLAVFLAVTVLYLFAFLYALTDLRIQTGVGYSTDVVREPLTRMFEPGPGPFTYEGIAVLDLWVVRWVFSPLNTAIGLGLSALVGLNLALSYLAITQPKSCGIGATTGLFASIPALLAGSTCCAPVIFLMLGIQASGLLLTTFTLLLPIGVILLLASLVYVTGQINPTVLDR